MEINGVSLEFNPLNADTMERYESAVPLLDEGEKRSDEAESTSEKMRIQCQYVEEFVDTIFGEGTSEQIFPEPDLLAHLEVLSKIVEEVNNNTSKVKELAQKYSPNRAQRRAVARATK